MNAIYSCLLDPTPQGGRGEGLGGLTKPSSSLAR